MSHPSLEVADIFRVHGQLWRQAHSGHISLGQLKVMSAIERCRSAALQSLRPSPDRLQLLSQQALPEVSVQCGLSLA